MKQEVYDIACRIAKREIRLRFLEALGAPQAIAEGSERLVHESVDGWLNHRLAEEITEALPEVRAEMEAIEARRKALATGLLGHLCAVLDDALGHLRVPDIAANLRAYVLLGVEGVGNPKVPEELDQLLGAVPPAELPKALRGLLNLLGSLSADMLRREFPPVPPTVAIDED